MSLESSSSSTQQIDSPYWRANDIIAKIREALDEGTWNKAHDHVVELLDLCDDQRGTVVDLMAYPGGRRCCICFEGFTKDRLYTDLDGSTWDVCWGCMALERPTTLTWPG